MVRADPDRPEWWVERLQAYFEERNLSFDTDSLRRFFFDIRAGADAVGRKPLKPASVKHAHVIFTALGNWCVEEGLLTASPMKRVPAPQLRDEGIDPFTDEELLRIIEAASLSLNPHRDLAIVSLLVDTGLRASELAGLRVQDLSLSNGTALVVNGKGGKTRTVAFGRGTRLVLEAYLQHQSLTDKDPLFQSERGGSLHRGSLLQLCRRLGHAAGVRGVHPHRFRHDCAIRLLRGGANVFGVMAQLGHSRVQTTGIYVKIAERDVRAMADVASPIDKLGVTTP